MEEAAAEDAEKADEASSGNAGGESASEEGANAEVNTSAEPVKPEFMNHPLLREDKIERRRYQETIIASASKKNTLVVLPTGIGKTIIAIGVAAHRLQSIPEGKIMILAPTKPLVEQHRRSFEEMLNSEKIGAEFKVFTGEVPPEERKKIWSSQKMVFSTPQVVENDVVSGRLDLSEYSLVLFDEAHRCIGDYAYTLIAKKYMQQAKNPLILGLTASPGGDTDRIGKICANLFIENVEVRTEEDWDVAPYVQPLEVNWVKIEFPKEFEKVRAGLEEALEWRRKFLLKIGLTRSPKPGKGELLKVQREIFARLATDKNPLLFKAMSTVTACIKLCYAKELLETQGVSQLKKYLDKLKGEKSKAAERILSESCIRSVILQTEWLYGHSEEHPKLEKIIEILKEELGAGKADKDLEGHSTGKKAIVFTQYVQTAEIISRKLESEAAFNKSVDFRPVVFIGQRKGHTQKSQISTIAAFRRGEHNILCSTSVAEEGLDIPNVDVVIFYEPIPSEIRTIQRRGRTGRKKEGKVFVLVTKGTVDEVYYWSSKHKERKMHGILNTMKDVMNTPGVVVKDHPTYPERASDAGARDAGRESGERRPGQPSLADFSKSGKDKEGAESDVDGRNGGVGESESKPRLIVDTRESKLLRELSEIAKPEELGLSVESLQVGDVIVSDRVCIERKTRKDFIASITDGRLFEQLGDLARNFCCPILVIEEDDENGPHGSMSLHPNAIMGAMASALVDFRIPVIQTKSAKETAELVVALAKRESSEGRLPRIRGEKKSKDLNELQEFIVAGFPDVNTTLSKRILSEFGTIKKFVNADEDGLRKVSGIGKEKAKKIREIAEKEYEKE